MLWVSIIRTSIRLTVKEMKGFRNNVKTLIKIETLTFKMKTKTKKRKLKERL